MATPTKNLNIKVNLQDGKITEINDADTNSYYKNANITLQPHDLDQSKILFRSAVNLMNNKKKGVMANNITEAEVKDMMNQMETEMLPEAVQDANKKLADANINLDKVKSRYKGLKKQMESIVNMYPNDPTQSLNYNRIDKELKDVENELKKAEEAVAAAVAAANEDNVEKTEAEAEAEDTSVWKDVTEAAEEALEEAGVKVENLKTKLVAKQKEKQEVGVVAKDEETEKLVQEANVLVQDALDKAKLTNNQEFIDEANNLVKEVNELEEKINKLMDGGAFKRRLSRRRQRGSNRKKSLVRNKSKKMRRGKYTRKAK